MNPAGTIIAFYSYSGGVGQTMTVANAAWILAGNGYRVLAVDWDLESPGLHRYFRPFLNDPELMRTPGLVDGLLDSRRDPAWLDDCTVALDCGAETGSISLIPAGRQDKDYARRIDHLGRMDPGELLGGERGIAHLRERLKARYDYVLIDGRTGAGQGIEICNSRIPDALVALFTLNHKTIEGTAAEADKARLLRHEGLRIFPVPARVEYGESEKLTAAMRYARKTFAPLIDVADQTQYWNDVEIPYVSYYAFEEIPPAVRDEPGSSRGLTGSHERLLSWVTGRSIAFKPPDEAHRRELIKAYGFGRGAQASSASSWAPARTRPEGGPARMHRRRGSWTIALAVGILLLLAGLIAWWVRTHDAGFRIDSMIDDLRAIERSSADEGVELPKAELNRAYTSLRAIREALGKPAPPVANPSQSRESR